MGESRGKKILYMNNGQFEAEKLLKLSLFYVSQRAIGAKMNSRER